MGDQKLMTLRALLASGDVVGLVAEMRDRWPADALQLVGDGLARAVVRRAVGADGLARRLVAELRARHWDGDRELADALDGRLGEGPVPMLRPLAVDLEDLATTIEDGPGIEDGRIDLSTGKVWSPSDIEYAIECGDLDPDDEDERWLVIECRGSKAGYRDMTDFVAGLDDDGMAARLNRALVGRGAFRRFKDTLEHYPIQMHEWHGFSEERQRGRARAWLAEKGYTPVQSSDGP